SESQAINSYKLHLIGWYDIVIDELLKILRNDRKSKFSLNIQKLALSTLIKFLEEEGKSLDFVIVNLVFTFIFHFQGNFHFVQRHVRMSSIFLVIFFQRSSILCSPKL